MLQVTSKTKFKKNIVFLKNNFQMIESKLSDKNLNEFKSVKKEIRKLKSIK